MALAVGLSMVGCAAETPDGEALGDDEGAIQGGSVDRTHSFAVAVLQGDSTCSGVLIGPNLVLTARHCVAPDDIDEVDCARDTFRPNYAPSMLRVTTAPVVTQRERSRAYRVATVLTPPGEMFCGNDIALLILSNNVPESEATPIAAAVQRPITDRELYGREIAALGYGDTFVDAENEGTRRVRQHIAITCIPGDAVLPCRDLDELDITETEFVTKGAVCAGDSGGSAIAQVTLESAPVALGVLSRADETGRRCGSATYTRTDAFKDFILAGVARAAAEGGYRVPDWASERER